MSDNKRPFVKATKADTSAHTPGVKNAHSAAMLYCSVLSGGAKERMTGLRLLEAQATGCTISIVSRQEEDQF